jgi:hypothetical protein
MMRRPARIGLWVLGTLALLAVALAVAIDPIATRLTRRTLDGLQGLEGTFEKVDVGLLPPRYVITRPKFHELPVRDPKKPLFYADRVEVGLRGNELLRGRVVSWARVINSKTIVVLHQPPKKPREPKPIPDVDAQLRELLPAKLERLEIRNGEVLLVDATEPQRPEVWLHDLEATVENVATRERLAEGRSTVIAASGSLQRSGKLSVFVTADPLAQSPTFAGKVALTDLKLKELAELAAAKSGVAPEKGTLDLFAQFRAARGAIEGGVKPVLKNVELESAEPGWVNALKAAIADKALDLASDEIPGRNAVATVVPIKGKINDPKAQLWPTVLGVVRNAYVEGLSSGFTNLPPPTAKERQGPLAQARRALSRKEPPAVAQPTPEEERGAERRPVPEKGRPPVVAAPEGLFQPGAVERIERALKERGYLAERRETDDDLEAATSAALRKLQKEKGLTETGAPDAATLHRLGIDPQEVYR